MIKRYFLGGFLVAFLWAVITIALTENAKADWRWADPQLKKQRVVFHCNNPKCIKRAYKKAMKRYKLRVRRYHHRRLAEWKYWVRLYIPTCTWYGESGYGPQYARYRYTMPNSMGSGAYGKFQMMASTYHSRAKYHDWSPLDQEIAARREFWAHGTAPWTNC